MNGDHNPCVCNLYEALDRGTAGGGETESERAEAGLDLPAGAVLLCGQCGNLVTHAAFLTAVNGRTRHTCTNPHGYTFTFRTFVLAPGCRTSGQSSIEHSWFPPHAWQFALCSGCGEHLGWHFGAENPDSFHALIENRLIEETLQ